MIIETPFISFTDKGGIVGFADGITAGTGTGRTHVALVILASMFTRFNKSPRAVRTFLQRIIIAFKLTFGIA